jgi:hypothetical protein
MSTHSVTKYEGRDQWLHFVSKAQELQDCLDSFRLSGCCLVLHPLLFGYNVFFFIKLHVRGYVLVLLGGVKHVHIFLCCHVKEDNLLCI